MRMELLGCKILDFQSDTGHVKGVQAFVAFPEQGVDGRRTDRLFFRDGSFELPTLQPGMILDVSFDRRGKPVDIRTIADSVIDLE